MRPPSYYASIVKRNTSNTQGGGSYTSYDYDSPRTSSQQLRSSLSTSSTSSYVSRSHLPFVPQSTLVAHCLAGVGSSTRPHGSTASTSGGTASSYRLGASPYSPLSTSGYSSTSSSASLSSLSSRPPTTKSAPTTYSTPASYSSYSRSTYSTRPSTSPSSRYRPTTTTLSSYYKPIRLRERPLLTQISRQIASPTPPPPPLVEADNKPIHSHESELAGESKGDANERLADIATNVPEDWSSDIGRNISRNKYLIKFREIEKQSKPAGAPTSVQVEATFSLPVPEVQPVDVVDLERPVALTAAEDKKVTISGKNVGEASRESESEGGPVEGDNMRLVAEAGEAEKQADKKAVHVKREKKNVKVRLRPVAVPSGSQTGTKTRVETEVKAKKETKAADDEAEPAVDGAKPVKTTKVKRVIKRSKESSNKENRDDEPNSVLASSQVAATKRDDDRKQVSTAATTTTASGTPKVKAKKRTKKEAAEQKAAPVESSQIEPEVVRVTGREPKEPAKVDPVARRAPAGRIRFREYNYDDFNFLTVLGHGGWGFVILAELKEHDACFAVKCIKKITIVEDDDYDSIMIERRVLALGNIHPFICKLFCTFETDGYLFFVMEYCPGGDLMFHVQHEGKFGESRCRFYASEIICAIRFLHNRHIIYRDLKLDNILLDARGHIRLVDFGMCQCRTYREEMLPSNFCGTPEYISPEIIKGVPYNHSVDWWSFGVLLYEMAVGKMPFRGNDENELLWNVCYEQIHYPMFLSKELTSLLKLLLEREPTARMGMATCKAGDIYDQPFFRGVDWKAVEEMRVEPPFVPEVKSNRDVSNFDSDFTESTCALSPVDEATLDKIDQVQFQQFPYTNPDLFIFDARPN